LRTSEKIAIAEGHSLKSCGIAIAEVLPSSCGVTIADSQKSCACPPLVSSLASLNPFAVVFNLIAFLRPYLSYSIGISRKLSPVNIRAGSFLKVRGPSSLKVTTRSSFFLCVRVYLVQMLTNFCLTQLSSFCLAKFIKEQSQRELNFRFTDKTTSKKC
jgi:hypothetical protein